MINSIATDDSAFGAISIDELDGVTGGGKGKRLWDLAKKAGGEVVDAAKAGWNKVPAPVQTGFLTAGVPGAIGAAAAWAKHKFD